MSPPSPSAGASSDVHRVRLSRSSCKKGGRCGRGGVVWIGEGGARGRGTQFVHSRSRMTIDSRMPTVPGRSTSVFYQSGRHCLHKGGGGGVSRAVGTKRRKWSKPEYKKGLVARVIVRIVIHHEAGVGHGGKKEKRAAFSAISSSDNLVRIPPITRRNTILIAACFGRRN